MSANGTIDFVNAFVNYQSPSQAEIEGEEGYYPGTPLFYSRNFNETLVRIHDIRAYDNHFNLDKHGFEFHHIDGSFHDWDNEAAIKTRIYNESSDLLKKETGATRVHVFSHIMRRHRFEEAQEIAKQANYDKGSSVGIVTPARYVHVDQSYNGAAAVLKAEMPDEAKALSKTRWGIINIWRPLSPIPRDPLAVCDGNTVLDSDLFESKANIPKHDKTTYADITSGTSFVTWAARANPAHKWYFASDMQPSEVLFIKCFDSKEDGRVRRAPHTAFVDPRTEDDPRARGSVEIRCLVFWEDD